MKWCRIVSEADFRRHCAGRNYRIDDVGFTIHADGRITGFSAGSPCRATGTGPRSCSAARRAWLMKSWLWTGKLSRSAKTTCAIVATMTLGNRVSRAACRNVKRRPVYPDGAKYQKVGWDQPPMVFATSAAKSSSSFSMPSPTSTRA